MLYIPEKSRISVYKSTSSTYSDLRFFRNKKLCVCARVGVRVYMCECLSAYVCACACVHVYIPAYTMDSLHKTMPPLRLAQCRHIESCLPPSTYKCDVKSCQNTLSLTPTFTIYPKATPFCTLNQPQHGIYTCNCRSKWTLQKSTWRTCQEDQWTGRFLTYNRRTPTFIDQHQMPSTNHVCTATLLGLVSACQCN